VTDELITVRESDVILKGDRWFVRMHEVNEHEGECWDWWLQYTGNEDALSQLAAWLAVANEDEDEPSYVLHLNDREPEPIVDKLVEYADGGYYSAHNKVVGTLDVSGGIVDADDFDLLYKGGIRDLFHETGTPS
jgi:hypothetical protein